MNRIVEALIKAEKLRISRDWEFLSCLIDIHDTILQPTYSKELSTIYYPYAKECLILLSEMKHVRLVLWSCSLSENNLKYKQFFEKDGIIFDYINENPMPSNDYADFTAKLYCNLLIDDKGSFKPEEDWLALYNYLNNINDHSLIEKQFKEIKEELIQSIISNDSLSKIEKLKLFDENNLFIIDGYIGRIFDKQKDAFKKFLKFTLNYNEIYTYDYFDINEYSRHTAINLYHLLLSYIKEANDIDFNDKFIIILKSEDNNFKISINEFIDIVYDFCIENKMIGFTYDW